MKVSPQKGQLQSLSLTLRAVGRKIELARIITELEHSDCRLLTFLGPGGIGKTRLAIEAARSIIQQTPEKFPQGGHFVGLASLSTSEALVPVIAETLGFTFLSQTSADRTLEAQTLQLLDYLKNRQMLLVLDNFEHLVEGAGLISKLLTAAPRLKILVTSRVRLNLAEEWIFEIPGMHFPERGAAMALEEYSAIRLFLQGARRARLDFTYNEQDLLPGWGLLMSVYLHDIPLPDAQARLKQALDEAGLWRVLGTETTPLDENALGRVTAEAVWARISSPHYHASAMDGFAVHAVSTNGALPSKPVTLRVGPEAEYVDTGDPLPDWANAVIPIENVESLEEDGKLAAEVRIPASIRTRASVTPWSHVRPPGEDILATQLVLPAGHILKAVDLGAIAASGHREIRVARKPKVAILPTGTELVPIGSSLRRSRSR